MEYPEELEKEIYSFKNAQASWTKLSITKYLVSQHLWIVHRWLNNEMWMRLAAGVYWFARLKTNLQT